MLVFGKYNFDVNENDIILDDGKCIQLITRQEGYMWTKRIPVATLKYLDELIDKGEVYTNDELKARAKKDYPTIENPVYWKFTLGKKIVSVISDTKSFVYCNNSSGGFTKGKKYDIKSVEGGIKVINDSGKQVILELSDKDFSYFINVNNDIDIKL